MRGIDAARNGREVTCMCGAGASNARLKKRVSEIIFYCNAALYVGNVAREEMKRHKVMMVAFFR